MAETLGEKLRAAREERGISISEVGEQTRIAPMYIECIENDNYKPLPGGIFNKGFVKSYARFIGFDEQEAIKEYNEITARSEAADPDGLRAYRPEVLTDDRASQSTIPTIIFAGIILALMTGGILFLVNYLQNQPPAPPANAVAANQNTDQPGRTAEPDQGTAVPTMQELKVEFRATQPISLSATSDGKTSVNTITPGSPQIFRPKQELKLSYAKSLASFAQLFINEKEIKLPSSPANPKRIPIEIEINSGNLTQIWNSGAITFDAPASETVTPVSTPAPSPTSAEPAATSTPRPATPTPRPSSTPAAANTPRKTPTPIVVGNSARSTPRPTPN